MGDLVRCRRAEGLHAIDVSIPGNVVPLATHPVQSESLYLAGRLVYLATGNGGLHLLKAGPIGAATTNVVQVGPGVFSPFLRTLLIFKSAITSSGPG